MSRPVAADPIHMPALDPAIWITLTVIGFAVVTAFLHTLSRAAAQERQVAALRDEVKRLRESYAQRLAELRGRTVIEVGPEDAHDAPGPVALRQAA